MKLSKHNRLSHLLRSTCGAALIEFAFALPVLLTVFVGAVELSNYVYISQKAQTAAGNIINIINSRAQVCVSSSLGNIAAIMPQIVHPYNINRADYDIIVTAIQMDIGGTSPQPYVQWQVDGLGGAGKTSTIPYTPGGDKDLNRIDPMTFGMNTFIPGDQILIVETFMRYDPMLGNLSQSILTNDGFLYHRTPPARPRTGSFQIDPFDCID